MRLILVAVLLAAAVLAEAQQAKKIPRIGILAPSSVSSFAGRREAFRQRLRELGYVEGKNILFEYRYADGKPDRLPHLAVELVGLHVDVIVTAGPGILAAKNASATTPIVFGTARDPVGSGIVASLARPGGNITGLSNMSSDLDGKRLELLKEALPKVSVVGLLWVSGGTSGNQPITDIETTAKALGLKVQSLSVRTIEDFQTVFAAAKKDGVQALLATSNPMITTRQRQVLDFTAKNRLPAIYADSEFVEAGGMMSYAASYVDLFRRAADFVDKILKGTKPADIPVEQPTKFDFVINLKTAKQIGLTIPQWTLMKADRVIK